MNRFLAMAAVATTVVAMALPQTACSPTSTQSEQQSLIDRATLTVQDMMTQNVSQDPKSSAAQSQGGHCLPANFQGWLLFWRRRWKLRPAGPRR